MIFENYIQKIKLMLDSIESDEKERISLAAKAVSDTIVDDGLIYIFGCGHSHMIAEDCFYRAGGLACVNAIFDSDLMLHGGAAKSSELERIEGIAKHIAVRYPMGPKDTLIVVSTSGLNPVPIDMAICGKQYGAKTIAITSSSYFNSKSRHSSGKRLFEAVDMYVDNHVPMGDAVMEIENGDAKMGPISTSASSCVINSILMEATELSIKANVIPPVFISANMPGGIEHNKALLDKYIKRVKSL